MNGQLPLVERAKAENSGNSPSSTSDSTIVSSSCSPRTRRRAAADWPRTLRLISAEEPQLIEPRPAGRRKHLRLRFASGPSRAWPA